MVVLEWRTAAMTCMRQRHLSLAVEQRLGAEAEWFEGMGKGDERLIYHRCSVAAFSAALPIRQSVQTRQ